MHGRHLCSVGDTEAGRTNAAIALRVYAHWLPDASREKLVNSATTRIYRIPAESRLRVDELNRYALEHRNVTRQFKSAVDRGESARYCPSTRNRPAFGGPIARSGHSTCQMARHERAFRLARAREGESNGEPGGNRTHNPQIKSLLLCQLSYRPEVGTPCGSALSARAGRNSNSSTGIRAVQHRRLSSFGRDTPTVDF